MRFTTAWASVSAQNVTLKGAVITLGLTTLVLAVALSKLSQKEPTVIERACYSTNASFASSKRTPSEIEAFLQEAITERFNSDSIQVGYLSLEEQKFREQELAEMKKKGLTQRVIVNLPIPVDGNTASLDTDRIISVGKLRSAFSFPLTVTLSQTTRSASNPYGLLIERVSASNVGGAANATTNTK
jgi:hypothetical protein